MTEASGTGEIDKIWQMHRGPVLRNAPDTDQATARGRWPRAFCVRALRSILDAMNFAFKIQKLKFKNFNIVQTPANLVRLSGFDKIKRTSYLFP